MRIEIADKMKTWSLKIFLSLSLGIHIFSFSILTLLFPDFKIDRLPPLHIEISLLPLISEAKILPEVISSSAAVETRIKKEEVKAPEETKEEESAAKQEQEEEQKISAFPNMAKDISLEKPVPLPMENGKWEMGNKKEEEKAEKEVVTPAMPHMLPSNLDLSIWSDEKPFPLQKNYSNTENPSIALNSSSSEKTKGTLSSQNDSKETSRIVSKLNPPLDEKAFFTQPRYAENPKPAYPQEARKRGCEGEVLLKVEVLANGRVGRVEVRKSSGYETLDRSALTAVKEWKFIPAHQGNGAISCWVNIPIKFKLQ